MPRHPTRNRLLAALTPDDFAALEPHLERVPLELGAALIRRHEPIQHVFFPESGMVSLLAALEGERVEAGMIGREGLVGIPAVLGMGSTPNTNVVQASGEALRITSQDLRATMADRPSIFRPLGIYIQAFIVQITQTAYVNAIFDIEARLARWLLMMQDRVGENELLLTHEFLSAMLGVRRPGVTVATHVLEGTGAIRASRGRIAIRDRSKLIDLAGDSYQTAEDEYERLMAEI